MVAENAILFLGYGMCQKALVSLTRRQHVNELNPLQNAFAGAGAAFFSSFALCPTELIKCKLQAMAQLKSSGQLDVKTHLGPYGLTKQILREEGILGMFRGLVPTFAREVPGYFFFFGGYEVSRHYLTPKGKTKDEIGVARTIICGGVGGVALWLSIFPADVIKSRVQIQSAGQAVSGPTSFFPLMAHIARTEGIGALYKGLGPGLARTFPATGALFLAYETTKKFFHGFGKPNHEDSC